jgi:2'-5' RNA ligase
MQHKIFIGVQLPEMVKKRLVTAIQKWQDLPVKWIPMDNFHATLLFLGYVDDEGLISICDAVKKVSAKIAAFDILFDKISLAPDDEEVPRMFWLKGEPSEEMRVLAEELEKEITAASASKKTFRPHVTLGRIRHKKWETLLEKPVIDQRFSASISVEAVEIFESVLENGQSKFVILESCPLA